MNIVCPKAGHTSVSTIGGLIKNTKEIEYNL